MQMANENEKLEEYQSEELCSWMATIPFSKPKKNLTRDFSDAVLMAEVLKVYYPRYVDLHNYVSANNLNTKKENWNILNRKVLSKIDMKLSKDTIDQLANSHPGVIEHVLLELRNKVLKDSEEFESSHEAKDDLLSEDINNVENVDATNERNLSATSRMIQLQVLDSDASMLIRAKQRLVFIIKWLANWLLIWNYVPSLKKLLSKSPVRNLQTGSADESIAEINSKNAKEEDSVPRHVYMHLKQEIREKDNIISILNHKVAYLESAMRLSDLRISNLTSQILQNAVGTEQFGKLQAKSSVQMKSRARL